MTAIYNPENHTIYNPETKTYVSPFADAPAGERFVPLDPGSVYALIVRGLDGKNYHRSATEADASWTCAGSSSDLHYAKQGYRHWRSLGVFHGDQPAPGKNPFEFAPLGVQFEKDGLHRVVTADGLQFIDYFGDGWDEATNYFSREYPTGSGWTVVGDTTPIEQPLASWERELLESTPEPEPSRVIVLHGGGDRWFYDAGKDRYYAIAPGNPNFPSILGSEEFREKVLGHGYHRHNSADRTYSTVLSG